MIILQPLILILKTSITLNNSKKKTCTISDNRNTAGFSYSQANLKSSLAPPPQRFIHWRLVNHRQNVASLTIRTRQLAQLILTIVNLAWFQFNWPSFFRVTQSSGSWYHYLPIRIYHWLGGRLYSSCVRSSMLHGSETWPVRKENEVALQWAEMRMVRWMCNVKVRDRVPSKELRERLGIDDIILILRQKKVVMVWACAAKRRHWLGEQMYGMSWRAPDQEVDQRGHGKRLCKKIVKHVIWTRRMLWIVVDGRRW